MPQLHLYLPDEMARRVRQRAKALQISVSRFLSDVVLRELEVDWPPDYFERVVGKWEGPALERPPQADAEEREALR